ncbi:MAG: hypothetical protein MUD17_07590 [Gemmatimonadaceae bacterium]|jgi:peptide subunit release factor RF-3|nr:hypothetical protein [Gemmatimonadaceae bacterium]
MLPKCPRHTSSRVSCLKALGVRDEIQAARAGAALESVLGESYYLGPARQDQGAVGPLQFEVLLHRLEHEYGMPAELQSLGMSHARWIEGDEKALMRATLMRDRQLLNDAKDRPVLLSTNSFAVRWAERESDGMVLKEFPD